MSRAFYTDYVRHSLRFYTRNRNPIPTFKTEADEKNWWACHNVLSQYNQTVLNVIVSVFSGYDTLADEVYNISLKYGINQNVIWDWLKRIEKEIAVKRGLL